MSDQSNLDTPVGPLGDQPVVGPGSAPLTDGTTKPDIIAVTANLVRAADLMATKAQAQADGRESKDFGQAALYFAQAVITLDPSRIDGGNHPVSVQQAAPTPRNDDEGEPIDDRRSPRPPRATPDRPGVVDRNHDGQIGQT